ncbi:MAG: tetratricopeptide repeat protein [Bryobacterales bacterium]|nr:tetratricopeptide repeat protein [Bryobacterales bacterium]
MKRITRTIMVVAFAGAVMSANRTQWEDTFEQAQAAFRAGQHRDSAGLYREAITRYHSAAAQDPRLVVMLNNLGAACQILGQFEEAESLYMQAIAEHKRHRPADVRIGNTLTNLAGIYRSKARYAEAEATYRKAIEETDRESGNQSLEFATALANQADFYRALGDALKALPLAERALRITAKRLHAGHPTLAEKLQVVACIELELGHLKEAEEGLRQALTIFQNTGRGEDMFSAAALLGIGEVAAQRRRFDQAEPLFRRAAQIYEQTLGPNHPKTALAWNNLAQALRHQGRLEDAEPLYQQALRVLEASSGDTSIDFAMCLSNYADMQHEKGNEGIAASNLKRAIAIVEPVLGPVHRFPVMLRIRLAEVRRAQRYYVEAIRLYREAMPVLTTALGPEDPRVRSSGRAYQSLLKESSHYIVMKK